MGSGECEVLQSLGTYSTIRRKTEQIEKVSRTIGEEIYLEEFSFVLHRSLENSTRKMDELSFELKQVDAKVEKYRTTFEKFVISSTFEPVDFIF